MYINQFTLSCLQPIYDIYFRSMLKYSKSFSYGNHFPTLEPMTYHYLFRGLISFFKVISQEWASGGEANSLLGSLASHVGMSEAPFTLFVIQLPANAYLGGSR